MVTTEKQDRARALKAVLDMIDSKGVALKTREDRDKALDNVIQENELTCWSGPWNKRYRGSYTRYQLVTHFNQLANFLKAGVPKTKPKTEVIWTSGSSVIRPDYLEKHLGFNIDLAVDNNLEENRTKIVDDEAILIVPEACSGVSGCGKCEGSNHNTLFQAGDGDFYCRPCVKFVIEEEDSPDMFNGCSDPLKSSKCKGTEMDKPNFYANRVLCAPCKSLVVKEEKSKAAAAEATASHMAEQSTVAEVPEPSRRGSNASLEIMSDSTVPKLEQTRSMTNPEHAVAETVAPALVDLDAVRSPSGGPVVDGSTQQSLTIHLKASRIERVSPNQHEISKNSSTTSKKRAAETMSNQPAEVQHKRPRESSHDELHQTGDTGIAIAHIQKEMDAILETLREIVMIFHFVNKLDSNKPALLLEREQLEVYPTLMAAYLETIGPDDGHWCELSLDNNLTSNGFLTALLGAMLYQQVFPRDVRIPSEQLADSTVEALRADLGHADEEFKSFQARLRFREVQSHAFQYEVQKSIAPDATAKIVVALQPQLKQMTRANEQRIPTSEWLTEFNDKLTGAIKRAFLLKARLQVAPGRYTMTWYATDSYFARTMMEAKEAPAEEGEYRIAMTLLPGWNLKDPAGDHTRDEVVVKATVRLDIMSGPRD